MTEMEEYKKKIRNFLPGGVQYDSHFPWKDNPLYCKEAKKSRVWDIDGKEYLDLNAKHGALILGHSNQEYKSIMKSTMDTIAGTSYGTIELEVMEAIHELFPSAQKIRFGISGSQILQDAINIAKAYTGREKIIQFLGHKHRECSDKDDTSAKDDIYTISWNNEDAIQEIFNKDGKNIAAVIMEPIGILSGGIMPQDDYLGKVKNLCKMHGTVLIFDETISGIRVGLGGAQSLYNIVPDITVLGKNIAGGGVPLVAIAGKEKYMNVLEDQLAFQTGYFDGYPLSMAAAKVTLDVLRRDNGLAYKTMTKYANEIYDTLNYHADRAGVPFVIQGPALCSSFHCTNRKLEAFDEYDMSLQMKDAILNAALLRHGIIVDDISLMYMNLSIEKDDVEWVEKNAYNAFIEAKELIEYSMDKELV